MSGGHQPAGGRRELGTLEDDRAIEKILAHSLRFSRLPPRVGAGSLYALNSRDVVHQGLERLVERFERNLAVAKAWPPLH
jgi:hypothetical protein